MKAYKIQLETLLYHNIFTIRMSEMRPGMIYIDLMGGRRNVRHVVDFADNDRNRRI